MYVYNIYVYVCNAFGPGGQGTCSRWHPAVYMDDAFVIRDLNTVLYPGRLTTSPTRLEFVSVSAEI